VLELGVNIQYPGCRKLMWLPAALEAEEQGGHRARYLVSGKWIANNKKTRKLAWTIVEGGKGGA
jgi:hypothetical protein